MTRPIFYEDFTILISSGDNSDFSARVESHAGGGAPTRLVLPYAQSTLLEVMPQIEAEVRGSGPPRSAPEPATELGGEGKISLKAVGDKLFRALFTNGVWDSFVVARQRVRQKERIGLRIRIVADPEIPDSEAIFSLPWELLYHQRERYFLCRGIWTPVVRHLQVRFPVNPSPAPVKRPLRILLAGANPRGHPYLSLKGEAAGIQKALDPVAEIRLTVLAGATLQRLNHWLMKEEPHILHFMGHCIFSEAEERGKILLEDSDGGPHSVSAEQLAGFLRDAPSLRFVLLNACDTSRHPRQCGRDPYSGLAQALVVSGLPAVAAMQFPISDCAAIQFSKACFSALGVGHPLESAITLGRKAVFIDNPDSYEWATPALYLSVRNGDLFPAVDILETLIGQGIDAVRHAILAGSPEQFGGKRKICKRLAEIVSDRPPTERYWIYIVLGKLGGTSAEAAIHKGLSDKHDLAKQGAQEAQALIRERR